MSDKNKNLPALSDLVKDVGVYEKQDKLNFLLNQPVPKQWISKHPIIKKEIINEKGQKIKVPYEYLAIDKVEYLLRKIFKKYKIEITGQGTSFNGVWVTVRVHYMNQTTSEWDFHDGIGASQLQTKGGKSPADLSNVNNGAISMAFPHAKTLAIKDACDMFGKLFGADLNRRDTLSASMDEPIKSKEQLHQEEHIEKSKTTTELKQLESVILNKEVQKLYDAKLNELQSAD